MFCDQDLTINQAEALHLSDFYLRNINTKQVVYINELSISIELRITNE